MTYARRAAQQAARQRGMDRAEWAASDAARELREILARRKPHPCKLPPAEQSDYETGRSVCAPFSPLPGIVNPVTGEPRYWCADCGWPVKLSD